MGQAQRWLSTSAAAFLVLWCICATGAQPCAQAAPLALGRVHARSLQSCDNEVWLSVSGYSELTTAYPDVEGCYVFDDVAGLTSYGFPAYIKELAVGSTAIFVAEQESVILFSRDYYWTLFTLTTVDTDDDTVSGRRVCYLKSESAGSEVPSTPENQSGEDWWCHTSTDDYSLPRDADDDAFYDSYYEYTPLVLHQKIFVTCGCNASALPSTPAPTRPSTMAPVSAAPVPPPTAAPTLPTSPTPAPTLLTTAPTPVAAVTPAPTSTPPTPRPTATPVVVVAPPAATVVTQAPVVNAPGNGDASTPTPAPLADSRDIVTTGRPAEVIIPSPSTTRAPSIGGDESTGGASSVPTSTAGGGAFPAATWGWAFFRVVVIAAVSIGRSFGLFAAMC